MTNDLLSRAPLVALSSETKYLISTRLNPPKVIPTYSGFQRDWRGLAQVCSLGGEIFPAIAADPDPSSRIFSIVQKNSQDFTLLNLRDALEKINRWDVVEDSETLLLTDAKLYLERLEESQSTTIKNDAQADAKVLTIGDQFRIERGETTQHYDAFLLYIDEDADFALKVVEELEEKNNLKLCLKDRDLIAGITFEHTAIMTLIRERCNRLLVIITPKFLESPANKFFINFAQANAIDTNLQRKIIPCVYKNCTLPLELQFFSKLYYNKLTPTFFWNKLVVSIKPLPNNVLQKVAITSENESREENQVNENEITQIEVNYVKETKIVRETSPTETSPTETSKSLNPMKRWRIKNKKHRNNEVPGQNQDSIITESIPTLPTLDGVDPLTSDIGSTETTRKSKKKKNLLGSVQALLTKLQ